MDLQLFERPENHPFGMLEGFRFSHTSELESTLAWMLIQCIEAGEWIAIPTKYEYFDLVDAGLLEGDRAGYRSTKRAKGLLYAHYGKE